MPEVEEIKNTIPKLVHKQSKTAILPRLSARIIVAGPSGVGKGVLVANLLLNPKFYRGCFHRIFYFSQSADVDDHLRPLKKYCEEELGQKEPCIFNTFDEEFLRELLDRQIKITEHLKKKAVDGRPKKAMGVCVIVDDFVDNPQVVRKTNGVLSSIAIRGRHGHITCMYLTQKYRALGTEIRTQMNALFFRQKSSFDLQAFLGENSAIIPRDQLYAMYVAATGRDHGFLYVDLMQSDPAKMFFNSLRSRLVPGELEDASEL